MHGASQQLPKVTPLIVRQLLAGHWRESITGSWFAGVADLRDVRGEIGELLLASKTCFAGQAHAFALACFADEPSAALLVKYLDAFLPKLDCNYDQHWAMPALLWVDASLGTSHATPFLETGGLWETFAAGRGSNFDLGLRRDHFWRCMRFRDELRGL